MMNGRINEAIVEGFSMWFSVSSDCLDLNDTAGQSVFRIRRSEVK